MSYSLINLLIKADVMKNKKNVNECNKNYNNQSIIFFINI